LRAICDRHKPQISWIFYFMENGKPEYVCSLQKVSKTLKLIASIIRSKGALEEKVKQHLEKYPMMPMDCDLDLLTQQYARIFTSVQSVLCSHCKECGDKWKGLNLSLENVDAEKWNDYAREVTLLRAIVEKAQFCIPVDEHFPYKDEVMEYGSEYYSRVVEAQSLFEFIGENVAYFFAMEHMDEASQVMILYRTSNGELPGDTTLNEI
jgi:hypothetical protein